MTHSPAEKSAARGGQISATARGAISYGDSIADQYRLVGAAACAEAISFLGTRVRHRPRRDTHSGPRSPKD